MTFWEAEDLLRYGLGNKHQMRNETFTNLVGDLNSLKLSDRTAVARQPPLSSAPFLT
jgi:hypothetical protein